MDLREDTLAALELQKIAKANAELAMEKINQLLKSLVLMLPMAEQQTMQTPLPIPLKLITTHALSAFALILH